MTKISRLAQAIEERLRPVREAAEARKESYRLEWVPSDRLNVDPAYQRRVYPSLVNKIRDGFDFDLFGAVLVSQRGDGSYWILDGQHRVGAIRLVFGHDADAPCLVVRGLTREQEAALFAAQRTRRGLTPSQLFVADVAAGDRDACGIDRIARSNGFTVGAASGQQRGNFRAINALRGVYTISPYLLDQALAIMREAYGDDPAACVGEILIGVAGFLRRHRDRADRRRLLDVLARTPPHKIKFRAAEMAPNGRLPGGNGQSPTTGEKFLAEAIVEIYNERLSEAKRLANWQPPRWMEDGR